MKHINEYAFWNKDSDIGNKIFKKLDTLKCGDISKVENGIDIAYTFDLFGFKMVCKWDCDVFDLIRPSGYYIITADDVKLDISWIQGMKIYKKVKKIFNSDKKEEERFIKKDLRITFRESIKKFEDFTMGNDECDICGGPIFGDGICPNCENEDNIPEPDEDIKDKDNRYKDHSHYNSNIPATTRSQQNYFM